MENDTETLLVMLSSLLPESHQNLDQESLLEALLECEGNVDEAAAKLISQSSPSSIAGPSSSSTRSKRKRHVGLDSWLQKRPSTSKPPSKRVNSGDKSTRARSVSLPVDEHHGHASPSSTSLKVKGSGNPNYTGNALARLKPPSTSATPEVPVQLPPLTLGNPEMVTKHTTCTLHPQVLPQNLATRLFETMLNEAEGWDRSRFWLFERAVESPHKNAFYVRDMSTAAGYSQKDDISDLEWKEAAHYWTQFGDIDPNPFPELMEEACRLLEDVVNVEMRNRKQFDLEWGGNRRWIANVAASNCYEGAKENVGFHSDGLTYLGPYPTIASLSLGVSRIFRLREVIPKSEEASRKPRSFNILLPHNSLLIMHPPTQEVFKHAIIPQTVIDTFRYRPSASSSPSIASTSASLLDDDPDSQLKSSTCRINITFRFFRPDYRPSTIPRCKCGEATILRPDMRGNRDKDGRLDRYWWACQAGKKIENEGKDCGMWKEMDARAEGRGPFVGDLVTKDAARPAENT